MESPHFNTSSIRDEWHRWESRSTGKRRYFSSVATVRTGWIVVVRFYGMLLLSAKRPRPPGRPENSVWKTIWRTIQRANNSLWSNGRASSDFSARSINTSSIWQESITWYLSKVWIDRGVNLEKRQGVWEFVRFGKVGRIRNLTSKNQRESNIDQTRRWWTHIPMCRWHSKTVRKRLRIPRTHAKKRYQP